jgi:hypothetical protein
MKKFILSILFFIFLIPFVVYGQGETPDIFRVKTPNVMVIIDTSSSMENAPDGTTVSAGSAKGEDGKTYTFEAGGNHPNSKSYQAKKALKEVIQTVVMDRVNLGFSTYAYTKTEIRRGLYSRSRRDYTAPTNDQWQWKKLYWRYNRYTHSYNSTSYLPDTFKDTWGITRIGVKVGDTFTVTHTIDHSPFNDARAVPPPHPPGTYTGNLKYTITARTFNNEMAYYTWTYTSDTHDHYETANQTYTKGDSDPINCDSAFFPRNWPSGNYKTYWSTDAEYIAPKWACSGPTKIAGIPGGFGNWYTEYAWLQFSATSCPATSGVDNFPVNATQTTKYTRVDDLNDSHLNGTMINCYDYSSYSYPADGSANKPHMWSYYKISSGKWPINQQTPNYYPSKDGSGNFNNNPGTFNNHHFFVNFPDDKDVAFKSSDRTAITNLVTSFLDLTPVKSPETARYWTKLPMHNNYAKQGLTANTVASSYTPLADSLSSANMYFKDYVYNYKGGDISSQTMFGDIPCRGNFVILLTDGLESCRMKAGLPDYDAAAQEAAKLLLMANGNVKTFVIGFGTNIYGNKTLNDIAVAGGTGKAYYAADFTQLKEALKSIFQTIANQFYGRSNPVITKQRDRLYRGSFEVKDGKYYGHLMAWNADPQTGVLAPILSWDSGQVVTNNGRGIIYTWTGNNPNPPRIEFKASDPTLYPLVNPPVLPDYPNGIDINLDTIVDDNDAKTVINFTLDSNYSDGVHPAGYYQGRRPVDWKLGDIYHSTPVVIGAPAFFFTENNYTTFYLTNKNREMMIYAGANDGVLHAFKNTDGSEAFSIIPKNLLGKLKNLSTTHDFYVDASPKAYDIYFNTDGKWKTVLISGQRGGGPYYFAMDVTTPNDPQILWELTDPNMGETWGKPDIGKVKVGSDTKFVAFLTGGYSTVDNKGNSFYIADIETGTILKSFVVGNSQNKTPSGPTAYDSDQDGFVNYVYFGDYKGTLWKVDVSSTNIADWTLYDFFEDEPPKRRPIFYPPAVTKNDEGKILVFFGTGDEFNLTSSQVNYFYEITDQGTTGKQTWTRNLDPGEKVLDSPAVANWVVYFTTWAYTGSGEYCGAGEGRLWGLKISKVGAPGASEGLVTLDPVTGNWSAPKNYISLGAGIPSSPVVTNGMIYVATSLNANRVIQIPIPGWAIAKTKSWREVF